MGWWGWGSQATVARGARRRMVAHHGRGDVGFAGLAATRLPWPPVGPNKAASHRAHARTVPLVQSNLVRHFQCLGSPCLAQNPASQRFAHLGCGSACVVGCTVFLADSTARRRLIASTPAAALFSYFLPRSFRLPVFIPYVFVPLLPTAAHFPLLLSGFCLLDVFTDRSERPLPCALPLEVAMQVAMPGRVWGDRVASARWWKAGRGLRARQVWEARRAVSG